MTLLERLNGWHARGKITPEQYNELSALVRRDRFSVFVELNALLYLGVLSFVGGLGWTINTYFARFGDPAIILGLLTLFGGCLSYCFQKSPPFSMSEVESPNFVFDYVLYLGCLTFSVLITYIEYRFHWMAARWDFWLLVSAILFFGLAYRFDNRFVLSLGLSALGGWFGVRFGFHGLRAVRPYALGYGLTVASVGWGLTNQRLKPHFLLTYFHIAANVLLLASVSGVIDHGISLWFFCFLIVSGASVWYGLRARQFAFVAYAMLYGYVGFSSLLPRSYGMWGWLWFYYLITGGLLIIGLVRLSRYFGADKP